MLSFYMHLLFHLKHLFSAPMFLARIVHLKTPFPINSGLIEYPLHGPRMKGVQSCSEGLQVMDQRIRDEDQGGHEDG